MSSSTQIVRRLGLLLAGLTLAACAPGGHSNLSESADLSSGIIGGAEVAPNTPVAQHTVGLYMVGEDGGGGICSGTLLANNLILTAAHCAPAKTKRLLVVFNPRLQNMSKENTRVVDRVAIHPKYRPEYKGPDNADIAILRYAGTTPPGYKPISILPAQGLKSLLRSGMLVVVAGYGKNAGGDAPSQTGVLRQTTVAIKGPYSNTELVIDQSKGRSICNGDSGGPAYLIYAGQPYVWGVASRVDTKDCNNLAIHTIATLYLPWIASVVERI